ncbi:MarR family winged helix-turn-helix transcriptional regulator [Loigolactobacillus bifermentans]|jgi:DNA-binding MarR family transcriptional regulator|nr:MarR family winged helix-turn-helix transcriptional regulator [Loigolactobacillus bifermentans]QGG60357.1 MarR family transcriptional regulator [Loigolactobacillus bifermentans]
MFPIIRRIGALTRLIQIDSNRYFKDDKLNNNLFIYIIRVVERPGLFLGALADDMQIDRTTSFRTVQNLIKRDYLRLAADPANRKIKRVYPTEKAKAIYPKLHAYEAAKSAQLLANLTPTETAELQRLLEKCQA